MKESENNPPVKSTGDPGAEMPTASTMTCVACGKPVISGSRFCGSCGAKQRIVQLCPRCGVPMELGFCIICDRAIVVNENPPDRICPHCATPIKMDAKYCRFCGKRTA